MNVFHKVTLQSLRQNRTRTIVTIIGVMLSAAMICAVTTSASSLSNYLIEMMRHMNGDWYGTVQNCDEAFYQHICADERISALTRAEQIGYAKVESKNEYKPYLFILAAEEGFSEMLPVHLISGTMPQSSEELILPMHLAENGGVQYKIGDTITLDLGTRTSDDIVLYQNDPCFTYIDGEHTERNDETLQFRYRQTFRITGFYARPEFEPYDAPGYTALTVRDDTASVNPVYDIYFRTDEPKQVYTVMQEHQVLSGGTNTDLLMALGVSRHDGFYIVLYGLCAITIGLIMFGSVALIYNAFSISVAERTKQFGLLSSIGATGKQMRHMVRFEALVISAVGIPLGIIVGISGISVTLRMIGNQFAVLSDFNTPMKIHVSIPAVLIACFVALITVLISAWIPSRRAMKVSAIEAIRMNQDVKIEKRAVRTPRYIYKLFGLPGLLAHRYFKRSRKTYRATILSLFMSITLFISASSFTDYLIESTTGSFSTSNYDIIASFSGEEKMMMSSDELLDLITRETTVKHAAYTSSMVKKCTLDPQYASEQICKDGTTPPEILISLKFVNDAEYCNLLEKYDLDRATFLNPEQPLAITIDNTRIFDPEQGKFVEIQSLKTDSFQIQCPMFRKIEGYTFSRVRYDEQGNYYRTYINNNDTSDILELSYEESVTTVSLTSGKTIAETPFFCDRNQVNLIMLYPESVKCTVIPDTLQKPPVTKFMIQTDNHNACYRALESQFIQSGIAPGNLHDYTKDVEQERSIIAIISVFSYGFIILISLIAVANVFNTTSTNINLRRREFAMLQSIGLTTGGFRRMMHYECILYGAKSLCMGIPISFAVTWLIYRVISAGYDTSFHLPLDAVAIAAVSVFIVVFITMIYSTRKIRTVNPIEALKNENI